MTYKSKRKAKKAEPVLKEGEEELPEIEPKESNEPQLRVVTSEELLNLKLDTIISSLQTLQEGDREILEVLKEE